MRYHKFMKKEYAAKGLSWPTMAKFPNMSKRLPNEAKAVRFKPIGRIIYYFCI